MFYDCLSLGNTWYLLHKLLEGRSRYILIDSKIITTQQDNNRSNQNFLLTIWNEKRVVRHSKMLQVCVGLGFIALKDGLGFTWLILHWTSLKKQSHVPNNTTYLFKIFDFYQTTLSNQFRQKVFMNHNIHKQYIPYVLLISSSFLNNFSAASYFCSS